MITENYTRRVRSNCNLMEDRFTALERDCVMLAQNNQQLRQERTVMAVRLLHLELMLTDKDYRKKFKKQTSQSRIH